MKICRVLSKEEAKNLNELSLLYGLVPWNGFFDGKFPYFIFSEVGPDNEAWCAWSAKDSLYATTYLESPDIRLDFKGMIKLMEEWNKNKNTVIHTETKPEINVIGKIFKLETSGHAETIQRELAKIPDAKILNEYSDEFCYLTITWDNAFAWCVKHSCYAEDYRKNNNSRLTYKQLLKHIKSLQPQTKNNGGQVVKYLFKEITLDGANNTINFTQVNPNRQIVVAKKDDDCYILLFHKNGLEWRDIRHNLRCYSSVGFHKALNESLNEGWKLFSFDSFADFAKWQSAA